MKLLRTALSLLLLSVGLVHADLDKQTNVLSIQDFSGGLNTTIAPNKLKPNESPNLYNYWVDEMPGRLVQVNGYIVAGTTPTLGKINFMAVYYKNNGTKEYFVSDSSQLLVTTDFNTYTNLFSNLGSVNNLNGIQVADTFWFCNGTTQTFMYNGTSVTVFDGTNGKPSVPIAKFIEYIDGRVFLFNSTTSNSGLHFSALASTDAITIQPYDARAWPVENLLLVNPGDGQMGTALWKYKGQLQIGKERSIHTLFGDDEETYFTRMTDSHVGPVSDESVVLGDGLTYFVGKDGFYKYDGMPAQRISNNINAQVDEISSNLTQIISDLWDTKSQYESKGYFFGSTATTGGDLTPRSFTGFNASTGMVTLSAGICPQFGDPTTVGNIVCGSLLTPPSASSSTHFLQISTSLAGTQENWEGWISSVSFKSLYNNLQIRVTFMDSETGNEVSASSIAPAAFGQSFVDGLTFPPTFFITSDKVRRGKIYWRAENLGPNPVYISTIGRGGYGFIGVSDSSAQYISQVTTISANITGWSSFNTLDITNGGAVNYFIRASTAVFMGTAAWQSITPGAIPSFPLAKRFVQWASTMNGVSPSQLPSIDFVNLTHIEGGVNDSRPIGTFWSNRWWPVASTTTAGSTTLIYPKARQSDSVFTRIIGVNIKSILNDDDKILYGGSATDGSVYRLDYGNNYNGTAIESYYETPDLDMSQWWFDKHITMTIADAIKRANSNLKIGYSFNGGSFTELTQSLSGSGRGNYIFFNTPNPKYAKYFRFSVRHNDYDTPFQLNGLGIFYTPTEKFQ